MKLFYSVTSPYSRKVLLTAKSLGLSDQITLELGSSLAEGSPVADVNPLGKVPALVCADGTTLFDSPILIEYLMMQAGVDRTAAEVFDQMQLQALADGIMDAAVNTVMDIRKPDGDPSPYWHARWKDAIFRSLSYATSHHMALLNHWEFGTIGFACALDYLCFRLPELDWQSAAPELAAWYQAVAERADMVETDPRKG